MITALLADLEARAIEAAYRGTPEHANLAERLQPAYGAPSHARARVELTETEVGPTLDRLSLYAEASPTWLHRQFARAAATQIRIAVAVAG